MRKWSEGTSRQGIQNDFELDTEGVGPTQVPEQPKHPDVVLSRVQRLIRMRGKPTDADQHFLDAWEPWARQEAARRFDNATLPARQEVIDRMQGLPIESAYEELAEVRPALGQVETLSELRTAILSLDGQEAVAFDTARDTYAMQTYVKELLPLWEALWMDLAVSSSIDEAHTQFRTRIADVIRQRARAQAFLQFYETTMQRVMRVYDRVSRLVTIDQTLQAPNMPRPVGEMPR